MPTTDEIARVSLFTGLPDKELKQLSRELRDVAHPAGQPIIVRGESGVGFMVIIEGEAEVTTSDGRRRKLTPGDHFGEMTLLDHDRRSADVRSVTEVRIAAIAEWGFKNFLRDHPEVAYRLLQTLSRRLREAEAR